MGPDLPWAESAADEIAREFLRLHEDSYGRPASNPRVALHEHLVAVVMEVELSGAEEALVASGNGDAVKITREEFAQAMAAVYEAIVERATGRRVDGFSSCAVVEARSPWTADVFRLGRDLPPAGAAVERLDAELSG